MLIFSAGCAQMRESTSNLFKSIKTFAGELILPNNSSGSLNSITRQLENKTFGMSCNGSVDSKKIFYNHAHQRCLTIHLKQHSYS